MKKQFFLGLGALALLASCSNDIDSPVANVNDGYLRVFGTIDEVRTRVSESSWETNDQIGVTVANGKSNILFTYNNGFTTASPVMITSSTTVSAYYPYAAELAQDEISFKVTGENDAPKAAKEVDFLYAEPVSVTTDKADAVLAFKHKMSRIALKVVDKDNALTDASAISITLNNVAVSGKFNVTDGSVTPEGATGEIVISNVEFDNQVTTLVPSYATDTPNTTAINVYVNVDGTNYTGSITPVLAAGSSYAYTLNIEAGGVTSSTELKIESATIGVWDTGEVGEEGNQTLEEEEKPYELAVGDFLLKDGTTKAPNDKKFENFKSDIVGVVYYVEGKDEADVANFGYDIKNGLAIAVKNANEAAAAFSTVAFSVNSSWFTLKDDAADPEASKFYGDYLNRTSPGVKFVGYNNTKAIQRACEFINDESKTGMGESLKLLSDYNEENKVNKEDVSEWYIPSYAEFTQILNNYSLILSSLTKVHATLEQFDEFDNSNAKGNSGKFYYTSDLRSAKVWVHPLSSNVDDSTSPAPAGFYPDLNSGATRGWFRFAIAF